MTPGEHTIRRGDASGVVVEYGGAVRSYVAGGRELLDGFAAGEAATGARGLPLLPWPNRIRDGRYTWRGQELQLPINEEDKRTALHGLVTQVAYAVAGAGEHHVELAHRIDHAPGYPFVLDLRLTYALTAGGLTVSTTATNAGTTLAPYGAGHHPYLRPTTATIDECELFAAAASYLPPDERGIPHTVVPVGGTPFDFRTQRSLQRVVVDACFTDLERDGDGVAEVRLVDAGGRGAAVWFDRAYRYVQLYTGDTLPETGRRRRGLAVEPMTCPPNAFQSGTDVTALEPGESFTAIWGVRPLG